MLTEENLATILMETEAVIDPRPPSCATGLKIWSHFQQQMSYQNAFDTATSGRTHVGQKDYAEDMESTASCYAEFLEALVKGVLREDPEIVS